MTFDWKAVISSVAPNLAAILAGPLAGMAVKAVSTAVLGREDGTEDEVATAVLSASPEVLARIKEAEAQLKRDLAAANVKLEEIAGQDRASARQMQTATKSYMPTIIATIVFLVWGSVMYAVFTNALPEANRDLIMRALGILDSALLAILYFYFGSSAGSAEKNRLFSQKD